MLKSNIMKQNFLLFQRYHYSSSFYWLLCAHENIFQHENKRTLFHAAITEKKSMVNQNAQILNH